MKQKILIPDGAYDFINTYVPIMTPLLNNMYISKGYVITPKDKNLFKTLFSSIDKEIVLNINPKKDPRRSKSTKNSNALLCSFGTLLQEQNIHSDLVINMSPASETTLDLIFNQFITPIAKKDKKEYLQFTLNGSLGALRIDRSNPFKKIVINGNNTTNLFRTTEWRSWPKNCKINVIDNTIEELDLLTDKSVSNDSAPSYYFNTLQSYSLKKVKVSGQYIEFKSSLQNFKLMNLEEFDISGVQKIDFKYNQFLRCLRENSNPFEYLNKDCKIKLNPNMKVWKSYHWNEKDNGPQTLKEIWGIQTNDIIEISFKDFIDVIKGQKNAKDIFNKLSQNEKVMTR